jgi:hypothetical protein
VEAPSLIIDLNLKKKVVKVLHLVIGLYGATNRKVAGSIPASVTGFFIDINPSDRTMALGSTQPLTEMSTWSIFWG